MMFIQGLISYHKTDGLFPSCGLSFVKNKGERGEILHGITSEIAARLKTLVKVFSAIEKMKHLWFGSLSAPNGLIRKRPVPFKSQNSHHHPCSMKEVMSEIKKHAFKPAK